MIRAIGFDLDDTLYSRAELYRRTYEVMQMQVLEMDVTFAQFEPVFEHYSQEEFVAFNAGEKSREAYSVDRVIRTYAHFGYSIDYNQGLYFNAVYHAEQQNLSLRDGITDCLRQAHSMGIQTFVLTNGSSEGQWTKIRHLDLDQYFDKSRLFVSGDLPYAKPNFEIFAHVSESLGIPGQDILYFGDALNTDIHGALGAGWQAAWLDLKGQATGQEDFLVVHDVPSLTEWLSHEKSMTKD